MLSIPSVVERAPGPQRAMVNNLWVEYPEHVDISLVCTFAPFVQWHQNINAGILAEGGVMEKVIIRDVYMFGPRIGFLFMDVVLYMDGVKLPGAVVLRGKSVAVVLWFKNPSGFHVVLVRQPRVATGRTTWEVPAGMADGNGTLQGQMFKEIREETGLAVNVNHLKHHGASYTSCGLLDETLDLYSLRIDPEAVKMNVMPLGNRAEGEIISTVEAVPLTDPRTLEDGKLRMILSLMAYDLSVPA